MPRKNIIVGGLLLLGIVVFGVAAADYTLSTDQNIDVPDRDVTFEGTTYTITDIARVEEGEQLGVDASGPSGKGYEILLYNPDGQIVESKPTGPDLFSGSASTTFDMSRTPGSYLVAIDQDGSKEKINPVVVKAYDVSQSAPGSVSQGESVDVTVDVTELSSAKDINYVEVVLGDDSETIQKEATKSNGVYEASISTDDLDTGSYSLYATVRGTKEVRGRDELLGFSDEQSVSVVEETPTPTDSPQEGSVGGGGGGGGGGAGGATTPTPGDGTTPTGESTPQETSGTPIIDVEPATVEQATIEDMDPESPGVNIEFSETSTVRRVTFDLGAVSGSVEVTEYATPPASVVDEIASQFGSDTDSEADTDSDGSTGATGDGEASTATTGDVVAVADISPTFETGEATTATVELAVPTEDLDDPENAVVLHRTDEGTWERLETSVSSTGDGTTILQGDLQSFSLFAVVDGSGSQSTPSAQTATTSPTSTSATPTTAAQTPTQTPTSVVTPQSPATETPTATPGSSGPGFTVGLAIAAVLGGLSALRRR